MIIIYNYFNQTSLSYFSYQLFEKFVNFPIPVMNIQQKVFLSIFCWELILNINDTLDMSKRKNITRKHFEHRKLKYTFFVHHRVKKGHSVCQIGDYIAYLWMCLSSAGWRPTTIVLPKIKTREKPRRKLTIILKLHNTPHFFHFFHSFLSFTFMIIHQRILRCGCISP